VAYGACQKSRIKAGDVVVVFGAGPIGLLAALLAMNAFGASEVHVVEPVRFRREFAGKWFDSVYDVETFFQKGPDCVDVVVEASGHLDNINRVFDRIAANGRVALLARSGVALKLEALDHMITNAISITGSRGPLGGAFKRILNLYQKGRIPLHEIVTDVVEGSAALWELLSSHQDILDKNCKVLARLED
jgi:D-xylulose reductase